MVRFNVLQFSQTACPYKQNYPSAYSIYPPSQNTTGMPVDECTDISKASARCHPKDRADNRGVAEGEDGYFNGTTGLPVGIH